MPSPDAYTELGRLAGRSSAMSISDHARHFELVLPSTCARTSLPGSRR
jgi:hypothetical protein